MKRIGILAFDGVEELEFIGPLQVFGTAARMGADCSVRILSSKSMITCRLGTRVVAQDLIQSGSLQDALIIPGGPGASVITTDPLFLNYVRMPHGIVVPVCSGRTIAVAAGLRINDVLCNSKSVATAAIEISLRVVEMLWSARVQRAVARLLFEGRADSSMPPGVRGLF
jgi:putative intracellular protease/amidase